MVITDSDKLIQMGFWPYSASVALPKRYPKVRLPLHSLKLLDPAVSLVVFKLTLNDNLYFEVSFSGQKIKVVVFCQSEKRQGIQKRILSVLNLLTQTFQAA